MSLEHHFLREAMLTVLAFIRLPAQVGAEMVFDRDARRGNVAAEETEELEFGGRAHRVELTQAAMTDHVFHDARGRQRAVKARDVFGGRRDFLSVDHAFYGVIVCR